MLLILLWAIALLYSFHFAGHLHNMISNVPNWSSGEIEDMNRYTNFYHKSGNAQFFGPIIFATIIVCFITLFFAWKTGGVFCNLVLADLIIAIGILIAVLTIFRPMNTYFAAKQYDAGVLKSIVNKWILYNYVRFVFVLLGLVLSIWALNSFKS